MARISAGDTGSVGGDSGDSDSGGGSDSDRDRREQRRRETIVGDDSGGGGGGSDTTTTGGGGTGPGGQRNIDQIRSGQQETTQEPSQDQTIRPGAPTGQQIEEAQGSAPTGMDPSRSIGGQDLGTESQDLATQGNVRAQDLEQRFVEENPTFSREDVVVRRGEGNQLVAGVSQSAYWGRVNRAIDQQRRVTMDEFRDVQEFGQRRAEARGEAFDERQRELAGEDFRDVQEFAQRRAEARGAAVDEIGGPQTTGGLPVTREAREIFGGSVGGVDTESVERIGGISTGEEGRVTGLEMRQGRQIEETTIEDFLGDFGAGAASDVTPHIRMTMGAGEGLQARAAREEVFAERAESGFDKLLNFDLNERTATEAGLVFFGGGTGTLESETSDEIIQNVPTRAELGAAFFQGAEIGQRQIGEITEEVASTSPTEGQGMLGDVPGNVVRMVGGGLSLPFGAVQAPVTAQADIDRDTLATTEELTRPPEKLAGIGEVSTDTDPEVVAERIAAVNPGVETGDVEVTRTPDGFGVDTDLSDQDIRERVAAFNPGTDPSNIWFTEEGDPMSTFIGGDGQTPTVAGGGTAASAVRTAEAQAEMFQEMPIASALVVGVPVARGTGRGFQRGLAESGSRTVPTPAIERFNVGDVSGIGLGIRSSRGKVQTTQPVVSVARGTEGRTPFELGTPEARPSRALTESVTPEMTGAETRIFTRALERSGAEAEATRVRSFRETQARTQQSGLQPRELESTIGDVLESQGISREAAPEVIDLALTEQAQIYGSVVQRASARRVGEPGVARTPRDIDIGEVASAELFGERATQRINEAVGREAVRLEEGTPTSVETGQKLFDIHEAGAETAVAESPMAGADMFFGVRGERPVRTVEGIETTTLSEQTARKGRGAMEQFTPETRQVGEVESLLTPSHAGRVKDVPDFFIGEMANIRGLELAGRERSVTRAMGEVRAAEAQGSLETWLGTFGEGIRERTLSEFTRAVEGDRPAPSAQLADFAQAGADARPGARSPTPSAAAGVRESPSGAIGGVDSPSPASPGVAASPSPFVGTGAASPLSPTSPFASTGESAATSIFGGGEPSPSPAPSAPPSDASSVAPSPEQPVSPTASPTRSPFDPTSPFIPSIPGSDIPSPDIPSPESPSPDIPSPLVPGMPSPGPDTPSLFPERGADKDDEETFNPILPTGQEFFNPLASGSEFLFGDLFTG